jgi:DNA polymerase-3 subunit gamma/tau
MLGTVGDDYLFAILDGLLAGDMQAMLSVADAMDSRSLAFDSALQELATLLHRIAVLQFAPQALADDAERQRLAPYAGTLDAEFLQLCYQIAIHGRDDLALAPDEYAGFVMTLLRLHAFRPDQPRPLVTAPAPAPGMAAVPVTRSVAPIPASTAAPPAVVASAPGALPTDWHGMVARLGLSGLPKQLAQHCELAEMTDDLVSLRLPPAHKSLLGKLQQDKLQLELQGLLGRPVKLGIALAEVAGETPAERSKTEKRERQEKAIAAIEQDGFVRDVIDESTIKPL